MGPLLESVFNHIVLPPKLPGRQDADLDAVGNNILTRLIHASETLAALPGQETQEAWQSVRQLLLTCLELHQDGFDKASLPNAFSQLGVGCPVILHIAEQNCAILIRRVLQDLDDDGVVFESFETSPSAEDVLAAEGAMQWDFPGRAAQIPLSKFSDPSFMESLATFIEQASTESLDRFAAHSHKAKVSVVEVRDTADPALITQMLLPLLEAIGSSPDVPKFRKRVRDDVSFHKALLPWRRLPFWLVLRVAIQRHLCLTLGNSNGRACYKFLICTLLSQLLGDSTSQLHPELALLLRAKLCRRLAKLEMEKSKASPDCRVTYQQLFDSTSSFFTNAIRGATTQVETAWRRYKKEITPSIPKLPLRADERSFRLSLSNSAKYLENVLHLAAPKKAGATTQPAAKVNCDMITDEVQRFTHGFLELTKLEQVIEQDQTPATTIGDCISLAQRITLLVCATDGAFAPESGPGQASISILNLFDLWMKMDKCAVANCPLLYDYHPCFRPELLDVLQLATPREMQRLKRIQEYLLDRCGRCKFGSKTIMSGPGENSFAARFVETSTPLKLLRDQITVKSQRARALAESNWKKAYDEYDALSERLYANVCSCTRKANGRYGRRNCYRCQCRKKRNKLRVAVHEDFLPAEAHLSAAVLFELDPPRYLAAYRDATWIIIRKLAHPSQPVTPSPSPHMHLKDYKPLEPFAQTNLRILSIASAKKSFLQSHYKQIKMKAEKSAVLLPSGLDFRLYDAKSEIWAIANQPRCPVGMSVHEFAAYQGLFSGRSRRWLSMLAELGSPNLNFSSEDAMHVISQLAIQAGPTRQHNGLLRDVHVVFQDSSFCARLTEQIRRRLRMISSNWRETCCMEMLITLSLRLFHPATDKDDRDAAHELIKMAREATLGWITQIREALWKSAETSAAEQIARFGVWASLLCRRTFATFEDPNPDGNMSAEDLEGFTQASVALQQNLVVDLGRLSPTLKTMMARDMKMAYRIQDALRAAIRNHPLGLNRAIGKTWSDTTDQESATDSKFGQWTFVLSKSQSNHWITCLTKSTSTLALPQRIHYNYINGRLLVDGSHIGKLPLSIRDSADVKELFGDQHLLTFPSPLFGMSHVLARRQEGQSIHFGLRGNRVVIKAVAGREVWEHIPRHIFFGPSTWDLPFSLIDNCVHWLNLSSGRLEIRRKPTFWRTRMSDWVLDVRKRQGRRPNVLLLDPHSDLSRKIAGILGNFEETHKLTTFQPLHPKGRLSVELRNMALSFFVNDDGLLQCRELQSEVDPNQDSGTLYGFRSGLVLRGVPCPDERSIIVPLGAVSWKRDGIHVSVRASNADHYGRFGIDEVLGQLTCPPEPRLLYAKALLHALTSFPLPDDLTRRTGTEEALRTLESGRCQPWQPIVGGAIANLMAIKGLVPGRHYYPPDKRCLQTVTWDTTLTMTIQHDSYESVVGGILKRSEQLRAFAENNSQVLDPPADPSSWLRHRAKAYRLAHERSICHPEGTVPTRKDTIYQARDRQAALPAAIHLYQVTKFLHNHTRKIHMAMPLKALLEDWKCIGGFHHTRGSNTVPPLADLVSGKIAEKWGSLVEEFRHADRKNPYGALFKLALLSFAPDAKRDVLKFLAACYGLDELAVVEPPRYPSFTGFKVGEVPTLASLEAMISDAYRQSDFPIPINHSAGKPIVAVERVQAERLRRCKEEATRFAAFILQQWPCAKLSTEGFETEMLDIQKAVDLVVPEWRRLYRNLMLSEYLDKVQDILNKYQCKADKSMPKPWSCPVAPFSVLRSGGSPVPSLARGPFVTISLPLRPAITRHGEGSSQGQRPQTTVRGSRHNQGDKAGLSRRHHNNRAGMAHHKAGELEMLHAVLSPFVRSHDNTRKEYGNSLMDSLAALEATANRESAESAVPDIQVLQAQILDARSNMNDQLDVAITAFSSADPAFRWVGLADLWVWNSPISLFELLRSSNKGGLSQAAKELLVSYGLSVRRFQRLQRINSALLRRDISKAKKEWKNIGHTEWSPWEFPDWLLLEIEGNILIRPEQVEVARAIIAPASGSSSVLQMNMGSGKTSCIVPMAMSVLADGDQLARLIVPKALLSQTAQIMQTRLGGLVGRDITHLPFSRRTPTGEEAPTMIPLYSKLHEQARQRHGIMLTTPEHILSYKLGGLQRLADMRLDEARDMISYQSRLSETCRDVLDESDFTLAVRTQLVYPSGPQLPLDGHPYRWVTIQAILSLVEDHLPGIQQEFPRGLELSQRLGGFPVAHFLQNEAEDELNSRVAKDISSGRTAVLALANPERPFPRALVEKILTRDKGIDSNLVEEFASHFPNPKIASDNILLVRGLLENGILLLCLKKRWNVQYGFHPGRSPVAVPFEAKGVPSEQSEFGHPDVALLLACLSFYYSGLTPTQFREGLQHVLGSGDPAAEYDRWTQGFSSLPEHLSHWNAINLDHQQQFDELWGRLRFNRNVLDHYMNTFVFPAHARQFEVKIQASGWDLPLLPTSSDPTVPSRAISTGFSGTNDNRMLLPLTIKQDDLPSLHQTNAEVLTYLLQPRNREYYRAPWRMNKEEGLLEELSRKGIRVLIDAGAYVLEQDNETLVKTWLAKDTRAQAAVYFGADSRAWVQYRSNKKAPLVATPFAEALDNCLVYLDEAHTRGVDLKLPQYARGALTLALGQTKDHTVQAAMRLRELGSTQAVAFFAPPEVHQSILDVCGLQSHQPINSSHVIAWLLEQTCRVNDQLRDLYLAQGYDFCRRVNSQILHANFLTDPTQRNAFLDSIRRPERQTLPEMYGTKTGRASQPMAEPLSSGKLSEFMRELDGQQGMGDRGVGPGGQDAAFEEVKQERQVERFQAEHVQQKQNRPSYKALSFPGFHKSIRHFVQSGDLNGKTGYQHAFKAIESTNTGKKHSVKPTGSQLFVSTEYMRTIDLQGRPEIDNFLRPVQWILWNPTKQIALIVVPEEAELLIPMIRNRAASKQGPKVHLITYMAPLTRDMSHFDRLTFYALPPLPTDHQVPDWLSVELGIFAGRMYADFDDCTALRRYMERSGAEEPAFSASPAAFLLEWLALRRKGQNVTHTPVGYVCQGRPLRDDHHFFAARPAEWGGNVHRPVGSLGAAQGEDGDESAEEDDWAMADDEV
ncbi:hypothetical protein F5144DRAFT_542592 [Chaetomium tenue]|uniref:Uncharacterized protein n=1 Tax=Chaetomium tenue TaxID=1854479 RepID=A0ACB7PQ15_9PEZI|nr:hypothetical protein F5144DRAFT_542592 [Chaetomium globosum]